jgi:ribonuclease J
VLYPARALVHVSGHASREELREMIDLLQPEDVLPFHGEHRHMALYADLAIEQGIPVDRITFAEIGEVVEITPERVEINEQIDAGYVYVDGASVGEVGESVIRDRRALARDGILMVVVSVDRETGEIVAGPEILTRGFIHVKESHALLKATKAHVREELKSELSLNGHHPSDDWNYLSRRLRELTSTYLYRETRRRPMILPMVLDV